MASLAGLLLLVVAELVVLVEVFGSGTCGRFQA
jgi:hypothetical protein